MDRHLSPEARRAGAMALVHRYVIVSAGAALIPIPVVDVVALAAIHVELIRQITQYYGEDFSEHAARNLLIAIGTSLQVYPVAGAVPLAKSSGARAVIVNAEPTPFDEIADAVLREPIGEILPRICGG